MHCYFCVFWMNTLKFMFSNFEKWSVRTSVSSRRTTSAVSELLPLVLWLAPVALPLHMLLYLMLGSACQQSSSHHSKSANIHRSAFSLSPCLCLPLYDIQSWVKLKSEIIVCLSHNIYTSYKSAFSPCSTQWPALQCCWREACIGAVCVGTSMQRAEPRSAELTPGLTEAAPSYSTWASPSGLHAPKWRFFLPVRQRPCGAHPRSSAPLCWCPPRRAEARILSDKHPHHDDPRLTLFATPSRLSLKLGRQGLSLRKLLDNQRT